MYESYTRQALPEKDYRELLGTAICVFNANNAFIIENILRIDVGNLYNWHNLIDQTSGCLQTPICNTIANESPEIANLFNSVCLMRNRIVHSFQITDKEGAQILATKDKNQKQFIITREYLMNFIKDNEKLSTMLHDLRGF